MIKMNFNKVMYMYLTFLLVGSGLICFASTTEICYYSNSKLDVISSALITDTPPDATHCYFDNNKLETIRGVTFSNMTKLTSFSARNNKLNHIDKITFEGVALISLWLSYNHFQQFPEVLQSIGQSLTFLDLSNNQITMMPCMLFNDLPTLQVLYLTANSIAKVENNCGMSFANQVEFLDMSANMLSQMHNFTFLKSLTKLKRINLGNQGLLTVNQAEEMLKNLPHSTNHLMLNTNNLTDPGLFELRNNDSNVQLHQLLDLSQNLLNAFPTFTATVTRELIRLNLTENYIGTIPNCVLNGFPKLVQLRLDRNNISALPQLFNFTQEQRHPLHNLRLKNNMISHISLHAFDGLHHLHLLHLQHNFIQTIPSMSSLSSSLTYFHLWSNQLTQLNITGFTKLKYLQFNHNEELHCLPDFASSVSSLWLIQASRTNLSDCRLEILSELSNLIRGYFSYTSITIFPNLTKSRTRLDKLTVNGNKITKIPTELVTGFTQLEYLDISDNLLTNLPLILDSPLRILYARNNLFERFPNLTGIMSDTLLTLNLQGNSLTCISHSDIAYLKNLRNFNVRYNDLFYVSDLTILSQISNIEMRNNPLICDCRLAWLRSVTETQFEHKCKEPLELRGKLWQTLSVDQLQSYGNCSHIRNEVLPEIYCGVMDDTATTTALPDTDVTDVIDDTTTTTVLLDTGVTTSQDLTNDTTYSEGSITDATISSEKSQEPTIDMRRTLLNMTFTDHQMKTTGLTTDATRALQQTSTDSKTNYTARAPIKVKNLVLHYAIQQFKQEAERVNITEYEIYFNTPVEAPGAEFIGLAAVIFISFEMFVIILADFINLVRALEKLKQHFDSRVKQKISP